jgi:hypothetical protein
MVMIAHGEEFGPESAFGRSVHLVSRFAFNHFYAGVSLVKLGRVHCKAAELQGAYAHSLQENFIARCENFSADFKEYDVRRKKLDNARCATSHCVSY